jgi:hypothetical protein
VTVDDSHGVLADRLRARVYETGMVAREFREAALDLGAGRGAITEAPIDTLAATVGSASYRVTDEMVDRVRELVGSDQAAFEVVMSASIGAGLKRWDAAIRAVQEATDAPS